jgi:hypothetical protein
LTRLALFSRAVPWASLVLAVCAALPLACAAERAPAREAPGAVAPELPLPSGLDVAVRVDLAALSAELGQALTRQFLSDAVSLGGSERVAALLGRSLDRAALLWFGLPPASAAERPTGVLVLRGHFGDVADDGSWSRRDSGVELLELDAPDAGRGYARLYRLPGAEMLIWAPSDELARVERALAGETIEAALRPPERGAVSLAARPAGVLARAEARYPELAQRFADVRRIEAFAEPTAGMWRADLTLDFASAARAAEATEVLERLRQALTGRGCALGVVARAVAVTSFERDVRVQTVLIGAELDAVKACVLGDGCCA